MISVSPTSAVTEFYQTDHQGSLRAVMGQCSSILSQNRFDSFGNRTQCKTSYGYTGREHDPDTGLMYYRARWYDSASGRFISEDPIGLTGGINLYAYVENDPVRLTDPTGKHPLLWLILGGAAIGGLSGAGWNAWSQFSEISEISIKNYDERRTHCPRPIPTFDKGKVVNAGIAGAVTGAIMAPLVEAVAPATLVEFGVLGLVGFEAGLFSQIFTNGFTDAIGWTNNTGVDGAVANGLGELAIFFKPIFSKFGQVLGDFCEASMGDGVIGPGYEKLTAPPEEDRRYEKKK